MPWAVAAAAVGAVGSAYGSKQAASGQEKVADRAAGRSKAAAREAKALARPSIAASNKLAFYMGTSSGTLPSLKKTYQRMLKADRSLSKADAKKKAMEYIENRKISNANRAKNKGFGSLLRDFSEADFKKDLGYQFRLQQGLSDLDRSQAARRNVFSGKAEKERIRYNQGFAAQEYGNASDRYNQNRQNRYNMLAGQAGVAQNMMDFTAGQNAQANEYAMQGANARAAGMVGGYNALTGGVSDYLNTRSQQDYLNRTNTSPVPTAKYGQGKGVYR